MSSTAPTLGLANEQGTVLRKSRGVRYATLGLLTIICLIAYIDRVNLSIAVIDPGFKRAFQLSNADRGLVNSAFFWSYAALQIPAGWLVDRYGSRRPLAFSLAMWSLLTAATSLAGGFSTLFAIRLLLGVGEAAMHPASMRWIALNFAERQRGMAIGVFMSGSKLGPAIGASLAAWLIGEHGWQQMFLVLGLAGLAATVPWLLLTRDTSADAGKGEPMGSARDAGPSIVALLANPMIWGTIIGTFSYMYFVYFCMTWMPAYYAEARGLSLASSSLFTTFSFAGMAVVAIGGGWLADRMIAGGRDAVSVRRGFTVAGLLIGALEIAGAFAGSLDAALVLSVVSLSGLGLTTANYWALTQTLIPGASVGRIVGIQNCAASVAGIVAPIATGWLVDATGSYVAPMLLVVVFLAIGVSSYLVLVRERYAPAAWAERRRA